MQLRRLCLATAALAITASMSLAAPPASAQTVTFADLEGAVIEASVTSHQKRLNDGEEKSGQVRQDWRFVIGPGERLQYHSTVTSFGRGGGSRSSTPETGTARLGRPGQAKNFGGGDGVWVFEDSTLTFLRTYRGEGGYRRSIRFRRDAGGFSCTITTAFARENGRGSIRFTSPVDGASAEILDARTIASSCRVAARG
jgi:hypothetical protein